MRKILNFLGEYKLFSFALLAGITGLVLDFSGYQTASHWVLGTTAIIACLPLVWGMWGSIREGSYGIDILALTAIVTAVLLKEYWAAIVVVLMLTGGESLEDYAEKRAQKELDALLSKAPQKAHVIRKGKTVDVAVSELVVGEKIIIKAGEVVPVDSLILEGTANFDESSLTGESLPQSKEINDQLLSGTINIDGSVTAKVTATAEDSQYQQIIKLVRGAAHTKAPFVRLVDRYSVPFTLSAFAIAGTVWILTGDSMRFLEVIIVATPCPLILAAPIALISGMSRASRFGIIVKTGSALEKLAEAETIAFDKTGTLTRGQLEVADVLAFGSYSKSEVLGLAAALEQSSNHVLAEATIRGALAQKVSIAKAKHVKEIAGRGLETSIKGKQVLVGRMSLLEDHDVTIPAKFKSKDIKSTAAYVAVGGELVGVITYTDEIRLESEATIAGLRRLGVNHMMMVTGDNNATAQAVAKKLGITEVYADALPADKLHALEKSKHRPLVFVGDGVNDAPALMASDVGIALGARGSTAASESADIVILPDSIGHVAIAQSIAKRTFMIARQSIFIGIGISLLLMGAFATGKFSPLLGALLQEVVDVVVIFNALRAHGGAKIGTA